MKKVIIITLITASLLTGGYFLVQYLAKTKPPVKKVAGGNTSTNTQPTPPVTAVVIDGSDAAAGDKLWADGQDSIIFEDVNPGTMSDYVIKNGNYAGEVLDISPAAYIKVQLYSGAPEWNDQIQTVFYLSKADRFKKG